MPQPIQHSRTIIALAIGAFVFAFGWWPVCHNFATFGVRSKMTEARSNLRNLCQRQLVKLKEGAPTPRYRDLGDVPDRNRYAYFIAPGGVLEERPVRQKLAHPPPVTPNPVATGVQPDLDKYLQERALTEKDLPPRFLGELVLGSNGSGPRLVWVLAAAGNVDVDPALDVWSVATGPRVDADGSQLPACEPFHERDDIEGPFAAVAGAR